jgi:hypothetical protein
VTGTGPVVTVLIPARDEADAIAGCLEAVLAQDIDPERLEVVVVDGGSTDDTGARAEKVLAGADIRRWVVRRHEGGATPGNLNAGLAEAEGEVVCRVDARSRIPRHYVRTCADVLARRPEVGVVGGAQVTVPRSDRPADLGIARALNNRFGMGLARYRRGAASGPTETVYLGAFRTDDLRALGGWDERFPTNQDFELNRRVGRDRVVWFDQSLDVGYLPRRTVVDLFRQYHRFGTAKVRYWQVTGDRPRARQLALLGAPAVAAAVATVALARSSGRQRIGLVALGASAVAAVEVLGPTGPPAPPSAHLRSAAASAAVSAGWTLGAWSGLARWAGQWAGQRAGQRVSHRADRRAGRGRARAVTST